MRVFNDTSYTIEFTCRSVMVTELYGASLWPFYRPQTIPLFTLLILESGGASRTDYARNSTSTLQISSSLRQE